MRNIDELKDVNIKKIVQSFKDTPYISACIAAYLTVKDSVSADIQEQVKPHQSDLHTALDIAAEFSAEECAAFLLFSENNEPRFQKDATPQCLADLAFRLLDIQPEHSIADFCCGYGQYIFECSKHGISDIHGYEINSEKALISAMRCDYLGIDAKIVAENIFNVTSKFDRIFSNFPFGMRMKQFDDKSALYEITELVPDMKITCSADWLFLYSIMRNISHNGKAAAVISGGCTVNATDKALRRYFVENGFVESVIMLPARLYESTMIGVAMIILSRDNDSVNFVDASKLFVKGRRINEISDVQIGEILSACKDETSISRTVSLAAISKHDYSLNPAEYIIQMTAKTHSVPFESLMTNITRGTQIKADELDSIASAEPTDNKFVKLADIQDGMLADELLSLTAIDKKYEKHLAHSDSVIISKNGKPIKIAVVDANKNERILVSGNMYIISLDENKINPYYLKAYLESADGNRELESLMVGVTVPGIPVDALKKLEIPLVPMEQQKEIADKYISCCRKIKRLKRQLDAENSNRINVFSDYMKNR